LSEFADVSVSPAKPVNLSVGINPSDIPQLRLSLPVFTAVDATQSAQRAASHVTAALTARVFNVTRQHECAAIRAMLPRHRAAAAKLADRV
jgi:hypothetical protein